MMGLHIHNSDLDFVISKFLHPGRQELVLHAFAGTLANHNRGYFHMSQTYHSKTFFFILQVIERMEMVMENQNK